MTTTTTLLSIKYSSAHKLLRTNNWRTSGQLYESLNAEFGFNDDPCPLGGSDESLWGTPGGLNRAWGSVTYMNPPYGKAIVRWLQKATEEQAMGKTVVCLVPSYTDTRWWHNYCMKADEIRFVQGRLRFGDAKESAPFASAIVIFRGKP